MEVPHTTIKWRDLSLGAQQPQLDAHSAFGVVYKGTLNGQAVAVKQTRLQGENDYFLLSSWADEVRKLTRLSDQNIARFVGVCEEPGHWALVSEWVDGQDLGALMKSYPEGAPNDLAGRVLGLQMAEGLEYLHKNGIVHLNLSPGNVIVNQAQTSLKLREYGFRTFKMANFQAAPTHGNPRYVACEVMMRQHDNITTASDVWSWAFVMYWVVTGSEAFKAYKISRKIWEAGDRPDLEDVKDQAFARVLEQCWSKSVSARPSVKTLQDASRALAHANGGGGGHRAPAASTRAAPSNTDASLDDMLADLDSLSTK